MTLEQAREDLVAQARYDLDLYKGFTLDSEGNDVVEAAGAVDLLSRACQWWAKLTYCSFEPSVALTLTISQDTYNCQDRDVVSAKVWKVRTVIINDTTLYRRDGRPGLWTLSQLQRDYPTWRTADDGTPRIAVWMPGSKLLLYQAPEAAYTGKNFLEAWTFPDPLTLEDDSEELPAPEEDHSAIVRLALAFGTLPNASEAEGTARLQAMDAWWREHAERRRRENMSTHLGQVPRGYAADWKGW